MPDIGVPELLIIAVIVLLLFGPGKAADLGGSLGKSIREFRKATHEEDEPAQKPAVMASAASADAAPSVSANGTGAAKARFCTECGAQARDGQKFCTNCGTSLTAQAS